MFTPNINISFSQICFFLVFYFNNDITLSQKTQRIEKRPQLDHLCSNTTMLMLVNFLSVFFPRCRTFQRCCINSIFIAYIFFYFLFYFSVYISKPFSQSLFSMTVQLVVVNWFCIIYFFCCCSQLFAILHNTGFVAFWVISSLQNSRSGFTRLLWDRKSFNPSSLKKVKKGCGF